jgi:lysophospholipase L1-like esterase
MAMHARLPARIGVVALLLGPTTLCTWSYMENSNEGRSRPTANGARTSLTIAEQSFWSPTRASVIADEREPSQAKATDPLIPEEAVNNARPVAKARRYGAPGRGAPHEIEARTDGFDDAAASDRDVGARTSRTQSNDGAQEDGVFDGETALQHYRGSSGSPPIDSFRPRGRYTRQSWDGGGDPSLGGTLARSNSRRDNARAVIPDWFHQIDADGDGQIALHEWRAAGRPLIEFQQMDRNQDGFVTTDEVRCYVTQLEQRRDAIGVLNAGAFGRSPVAQKARSSPQPAPVPAAVAPNRPAPATSSRPLSPKTQTRIAPPAAAAPTIDTLATTPLPLNDGTNPYWLARDAQNEARISLGHANVLFLGDSITDLLQSGAGQPIWKTFFAPLGAADFAVGGVTTSEVLWQVQTGQVAAVTPNVVVLLIGSNNLGTGQSPAATVAGVEAIVDQVRGQLPDTRILLLGLLPRSASAADPIRTEILQVNRAIAKLADGQNVRFLDFGSAYLLPDGTLPRVVMPDLLHPSLLGYQIYAAAIWRPLLALLEGQ